ncbi:MAG: DUF3251 domain-containing protein [Desulfobacteraceae bacterium]|jgi:hypothetical protein|nr:DUF3251 domain-containing protein [Desulfobacteraceae bacterium]
MGSSSTGCLSGWVKPVLLILLIIYSFNGHSNKINRLKRDVRKLKNASVRLTPGVDGYQTIRHDLGYATLNLKEVKEHAKGSDIILVIGNATSVHITGVTMTISYPVDFVEHSHQYDVQQTLAAGKATKARFILEGVKPSELSYIYVSDFQPKGIQLIHEN